jgi:DNA-binding CsgD family transcriptional regulator
MRDSVAASLKSEASENPILAVGFAFLWTWVWFVFQSSLFGRGVLAHNVFGGVLPAWFVPLLSCALGYVLLGFLYRRRGFVLEGGLYRAALAVSVTLGIACCACVGLWPTANHVLNIALSLIGNVVMGAGTACMFLEWAQVMSSLGPRRTIIQGFLGTLGAACIVLLVDLLLDEEAIWLVVAPLPLLIVGTLRWTDPPSPGVQARDFSVRLSIPWRFIATFFVQGCAFGFLQVAVRFSDAENFIAVNVLGTVLGVLVLVVCALSLRLDLDQLLYQVGFLIIGLGYLLFIISDRFFAVGWLLNTAGYKFIVLLLWALGAYWVKFQKLPVHWVFAVNNFSLLAGQIFGGTLGYLAIHQLALGADGLNSISEAMLFLLFVSALMMLDRKNLLSAWGMIRPGTQDDFEVSCDLACEGYGLTAREGELFALLARGYDRATIGEELVLSPETVKTHVRNIYRKMDIHSQKEIVALVRRQSDESDMIVRHTDTV